MLGGCGGGGPVRSPATTPAGVVARPSARGSIRQTVTGIWDWQTVFRAKGGDLRAEQEAWFLTQKGNRITGRYRRFLTRVSMDGRVFGCNGATRYTLEAEFVVQGIVRNGSVRIREKSYRVRSTSCETGKRRLDSYLGRFDGRKLVLYWETGQQVLTRRNLTGVWTWRRQRLNRGGDTEVLSERWHIRQNGSSVEGFRHRSDLHISNDRKRYRCNSHLRMSRFVRWPFRGRVNRDDVSLKFGVPRVKPTPCERRRLAYTRGSLKIAHHPNRVQAVLPEGRFVLERQVGADPGRMSVPSIALRRSRGSRGRGEWAGAKWKVVPSRTHVRKGGGK
jgi:hypothetical protein